MNGPVQSAESIKSTSEAPDNNKSFFNRSSRNAGSQFHNSGSSDRPDNPDLSISDDGNAGGNSKALSTAVTILGALWIIFPDFVPGPIDDLFVLFFLAFSNPGFGAFMGDAFRALLAMAALIWVVMPDLCPGPVDDVLVIILSLSLLPKPRR